MKNFIPIIFVLSSIVLCCNSKKPESHNNNTIFAGNWISKNYIDSLDKNGTPFRTGNISCAELIINFTTDSACLLNAGGEMSVFKIENKSDSTFRIKKFNQDDYSEFILSPNGRELTYESKKEHLKYTFKKIPAKYAVKVMNGWTTAMELFFNEHIIAANYFLINADNKPENLVSFNSYGKISGIPGYTDFKLCLGGDCMSMSEEDIIELSDAKSSEYFIWEWRNDTLVFSSVVNFAGQNEKPFYKKNTDIFRLIKKI